jgi:hypothetical protein
MHHRCRSYGQLEEYGHLAELTKQTFTVGIYGNGLCFSFSFKLTVPFHLFSGVLATEWAR